MALVARGGGPRLLITHRNACVLIERARVHVSGDRVVYHAAEPGMIKRFNLPHCNTAVVFLGQGTSITQEAAQRLAEESVLLAFTGSGGTPLLMGSLVTYQATSHFRRMLRVYDSLEGSLSAAKNIMRARVARMRAFSRKRQPAVTKMLDDACLAFDGDILAATDHGGLMSSEGAFAKSCYVALLRESGVDGFIRKPGKDAGIGRVGVINRMIDHGNYLAYGIAGAALWALGIPVHMSVMHGKTRAGGLAFDVADSWKDSVIIPLAIEHSLTGDETAFRQAVVDTIEDEDILAFSLKVVEEMILEGEKVIGDPPKDLRFEGYGKTK